jgi:hypothetical protein
VIHTFRLETADGIETFNVNVRKRDDGLAPYLAECTTMFKWYSQRGNTYQEALINVLNTIVQSLEFKEEI